MSYRTNRAATAGAGGFSLMEVLVAIGIFVLGFVAVAAIFPAGAVLQRNTADDVESMHVERGARSMIRGTPLFYERGSILFDIDGLPYYDEQSIIAPSVSDITDFGEPPPSSEEDNYFSGENPHLYFYHHVDPTAASNINGARNYLRPLALETDNPNDHILSKIWPLEARSYPVSRADTWERDFYWVPLIRDTAGNGASPAWEMIVFVLKNERDATYGEATYPADGPRDFDLPGEPLIVPGLMEMDVTIEDVDVFDFGEDMRGYLRPNDWLVDNAGGIYRVIDVLDDEGGEHVEVDSAIMGVERYATYDDKVRENWISPPLPTTVWLAPPPDGGTRSAARRVFRVKPWVQEPPQ